jgi:hypothetical protein
LERSLWTRLDLSPAGGVAEERVTEALFRGAAARARGGLTALDVSECYLLLSCEEVLLEVLAANAGALTELRYQFLGLAFSKEDVEALLGAAPLLRECHMSAIYADAPDARRMLRNEPPFGPLRLHKLDVQPPWTGGEADMVAFAADLTASALSLSQLMLSSAPLGGRATLDAVVDAALARQLTHLLLDFVRLSAASVPALARLLGGNALNTLVVQHTGAEPLLLSGAEGSAALLAAALRANNTLATLCVTDANMWYDVAAEETLLGALTAHPSLRYVRLDCNAVRTAGRARAGASLGALVAANAPALTELNVSGCRLGDVGLGPLVDALASNTHLQVLQCWGNAISDAFALQRLRPALLANASLQRLRLVDFVGYVGGEVSPALRPLEQLVAERAAEREAAAAAVAAAAAQ